MSFYDELLPLLNKWGLGPKTSAAPTPIAPAKPQNLHEGYADALAGKDPFTGSQTDDVPGRKRDAESACNNESYAICYQETVYILGFTRTIGQYPPKNLAEMAPANDYDTANATYLAWQKSKPSGDAPTA
jgi:hypothetical protein